MVKYDLQKKEPNVFELRAYLFQLLGSGYNFSEKLREDLIKEHSITGTLDEIDLNRLNREQIVSFIESHNSLPKYIYFFNRKKEYILSDYKHYPELFTNVMQLSFFDNSDEGVIVLEKFCTQIYNLFSNDGKGLLDDCSDLDLGAYGYIQYRLCDDLSGWWSYENLEGEFNNSSFSRDNFPNIWNRDQIALTNNGIEPKYEEFDLWQGDDYKIAEILDDDGCMIRYMGDLRDNEDYAYLACKKNYLAFTLISQRLREDKNFVMKILELSTKEECIYRFLNKDLQKDEEIFEQVLKLSKNSLYYKDVEDYNRKNNIDDKIEYEDELPF
jgi:hypothetical protein